MFIKIRLKGIEGARIWPWGEEIVWRERGGGCLWGFGVFMGHRHQCFTTPASSTGEWGFVMTSPTPRPHPSPHPPLRVYRNPNLQICVQYICCFFIIFGQSLTDNTPIFILITSNHLLGHSRSLSFLDHCFTCFMVCLEHCWVLYADSALVLHWILIARGLHKSMLMLYQYYYANDNSICVCGVWNYEEWKPNGPFW